ncbi:MAG: BTAD domain-containing putative transcriptional regulator, partial [Chloroflexota bacterium]
MSHLHLSCFQGFQATLDNQAVVTFRSAKGRALLIYLAVEQPHTHQRESLAGLLWPDEVERTARRNLSQTLLEIRKGIKDQTSDPPFLTITSQTIAFNPDSHHTLDVVTFRQQMATIESHDHDRLETCSECCEKLQDALSLYQGPFLENFSLPDSDLFENWLQTQREFYHQQALEAFSLLAYSYEAQGDYEQAQKIVRNCLQLVPWHEEAHRQLIRVLALSGQRSLALTQYDTCARILEEELGIEPSPETQTLYEQIKQGDLSLIEPALSRIALPQTPFQAPLPPAHFVGREDQMGELKTSLTQAGAQIYALVGMGGVGKTTLAAQTAHYLRDTFSDGVLWGNVAISTPMDILVNWGNAYDYDFSGLSDLESRAAAVRNLLNDKKILLIIDNVVTSRDIQALLPNGIDCATLLTTRDLDVAHALNAESLLLGELSAENARQLLVYILGEARVTAEEDAAQEICTLLQNLPLAVEIVAQRLKSRARQTLAQMATRLRATKNRMGLNISDQAVRASFEVSWEALDEELREIFPLLGVFEGRPFPAEAIAHIADIDVFDAEDHLYALTALSLLKEDGDIHFRQHPLLADFA